jgi:sugar lactone lactonase YvrE
VLAVGGGFVFFMYGSTLLERTPDTLDDAGFTQVGTVALGTSSMKTNSSDVFVMSRGGTLMHAPLDTSNLTELEHDQTDPSEIAVDDEGVFWATDSDSDRAVLHARPLTAGASTPIATALDHPDGTALDESHVYVALRGTPPGYTDGKIVRVPRGGGAVEPLADGIVYPHRIAVTPDYVVFTSRGTLGDAGYAGGAIYRVPK